MKPNDEQIKELWEWCGWKVLELPVRIDYDKEHPMKAYAYYHQSGVEGKEWALFPQPELDLNNLFKWAVPKLSGCELYWYHNDDEWRGFASSGYDEKLRSAEHYDKDPALALFWAIYKVFKNT